MAFIPYLVSGVNSRPQTPHVRGWSSIALEAVLTIASATAASRPPRSCHLGPPFITPMSWRGTALRFAGSKLRLSPSQNSTIQPLGSPSPRERSHASTCLKRQLSFDWGLSGNSRTFTMT